MRDASLYFLFSSLTGLKGVGAGTAQALARLLLPKPAAGELQRLPVMRDLLFHLPVAMLDRSFTCPLASAPEGVIATFVVKVQAHLPPSAPGKRGGRKPYRVQCVNETGEIMLVFFNAKPDYLAHSLPVGAMRVISGRTEKFDYRLQMTHPDVIAPLEELVNVQKPEPVYPLTLDITNRRLMRMIDAALALTPDLPEWISAEVLASHGWSAWKKALCEAHKPTAAGGLSPLSPARARLAYDEILANQLQLALIRNRMQRRPGPCLSADGGLRAALIARLPFALTAGQRRVMEEIESDMTSGGRMVRLLLGDVGSGKTVVALLAMLHAVEAGAQAALMVPTEIIAQQHFETLTRLTQGLGVRIELLTGGVKGRQRQEVLQGIAAGEVHLAVGTHALFQEQVIFHRLALAVIDEQHRFGVAQRMALSAKGENLHILHMTATPIPRSLTMTLYGDMECSLLKEKPAGRQPIATRAAPLSRYEEIIAALRRALERQEKAYWICPLIEESLSEDGEGLLKEDLAAAESRYHEFRGVFGDCVGLVHGRMKSEARAEEMRCFANGKTRLLVATTVIEVGVDVPDATIMVIEKAERFGLAQLHQLRGRVGRGSKPSFCVLLYGEPLADDARARLLTLRSNDDGFEIAEQDLRQRGGGDLLGTRQSGMPRFLFTDLVAHEPLIAFARTQAKAMAADNQELAEGEGSALRVLLQLFGKEMPWNSSSGG